MKYINKKFLLNRRPVGMPENNCWKLIEEKINSLKKGEILIEVKFLSIDPYMRGRMNDVISYAAPAKIGEPMTGETVGEVVESKSSVYEVGDIVCIHKGWQTYIRANDTDLSIYKVPLSTIPMSSYLGAVGMPGRTAFFGLNRVGKPKENETVVVSAASGAVGSIVGQLALMHNCHVVGIAGGPSKCAFVKETLGFNACLDYKSERFKDDLKSVCSNGVDIYFENVGGPVTKEVSYLLNEGARVPICGFISQYNEKDMLNSDTPFKILGKLKNKPFHRFFVVTEWMDEWQSATQILSNHVAKNEIKYKETITEGFENAPQALRDVLTGKNFGKQIIKI